MIFYPIQTLVNAGITEILIVVGGPFAGNFISVLKNGQDLGITHLEYAFQENEGGIAHALSLAETFAEGDSVTVILGDNTSDSDISEPVKNFRDGALIFLKSVPDPHRFGIATFDPEDKSRILKITEKPKEPDSDMAVTGVYIYDSKVFEFIREIEPSGRGELEITDVNNKYVEKGELRWDELKGYWWDAGTFDTLLEANNYWAKKGK